MYCYATQSKTCFVYALRHVLFCSFIFYDIIGLQVSKPIHNVITYKDCWRCKYLGIRKKIELIFPVHRWMHFFCDIQVSYSFNLLYPSFIFDTFYIHSNGLNGNTLSYPEVWFRYWKMQSTMYKGCIWFTNSSNRYVMIQYND